MNLLCVVALLIVGGGDSKLRRWDFDEATLGKLPESWNAAKTEKGNVWKVVEDKTSPKGAKVLAQVAADGPGSVFNVCVADKSSYADLDLSVSFKAVAGKKDQGGGPVWRFKDFSNYYVVRMNPLEDNFRLYKVVDGKRIQLATADVAVVEGKWHTIRVVHQGNRIQCYLNGKMHFEVKDDTFKDAGKIGVWTKADAQTRFDAITIRKPN